MAVRIDGIQDRESFETWLRETGQPREVCVALANRAALRTAPVWWRRTPPVGSEEHLKALPICRALLISEVAAEESTSEIRTAATAASASANGCADTTHHLTDFATDADGLATSAALGAAAAADAVSAATAAAAYTHAANAAARTAAVAADAYTAVDASPTDVARAAAAAAWESLRRDCARIAVGHIFAAPLWSGKRPFEDHWTKVRRAWSASGPGWRFWIDWYEAALEGRSSLDPALLTEIATQPGDFWQGSDDEVNARIARIRERHDLLAEVRALKAEREAWRARASPAQRSHNMPPELIDAPAEVERNILVIWDWLDLAERELQKPSLDKGRLAEAATTLLTAANALKAVMVTGAIALSAGFMNAAGERIFIELLDTGRLVDLAQRLLSYATGG